MHKIENQIHASVRSTHKIESSILFRGWVMGGDAENVSGHECPFQRGSQRLSQNVTIRHRRAATAHEIGNIEKARVKREDENEGIRNLYANFVVTRGKNAHEIGNSIHFRGWVMGGDARIVSIGEKR